MVISKKAKSLGTSAMFVLSLLCVSGAASAEGDVKKLKSSARKVSSMLKRRNKKASSAVVGVRRSKAVKAYFSSSQSPAAQAKNLKKIEKMSLHTHTKYKMDEMCVINKDGQEIARIVDNAIAPSSDLSSEEASAPFFRPSMALSDKEVHIEYPYMSPDSARFVIAYTTPVVTKDGSKPAFIHYEKYFGLYIDDIKRNFFNNGMYAIVVGNGYVWGDTRSDKAYNIKDKKEDEGDYFAKVDPTLVADAAAGNGATSIPFPGIAGLTIIVGYK